MYNGTKTLLDTIYLHDWSTGTVQDIDTLYMYNEAIKSFILIISPKP